MGGRGEVGGTKWWCGWGWRTGECWGCRLGGCRGRDDGKGSGGRGSFWGGRFCRRGEDGGRVGGRRRWGRLDGDGLEEESGCDGVFASLREASDRVVQASGRLAHAFSFAPHVLALCAFVGLDHSLQRICSGSTSQLPFPLGHDGLSAPLTSSGVTSNSSSQYTSSSGSSPSSRASSSSKGSMT